MTDPLPRVVQLPHLTEGQRQQILQCLEKASAGCSSAVTAGDWRSLEAARADFANWEKYQAGFLRNQDLKDLGAVAGRAKRLFKDLRDISDLVLAEMLFEPGKQLGRESAGDWRKALLILGENLKHFPSAPGLRDASDWFGEFLEVWWRRISGTEPTVRHDDYDSHYHAFVSVSYQGIKTRGLSAKALSDRRTKRNAARTKFAEALQKLKRDRG